MKKLLFSLAVSSILVSCTLDLGNLSLISSEDINMNQKYELALKQQTYTANSLEACVDLALKTVPNSVYLKNAKISSKGKKVTVVADVWSLAKKQPQKNPGLTLDKYKKPKGQIPKDKLKFIEALGFEICVNDSSEDDPFFIFSISSSNSPIRTKQPF